MAFWKFHVWDKYLINWVLRKCKSQWAEYSGRVWFFSFPPPHVVKFSNDSNQHTSSTESHGDHIGLECASSQYDIRFSHHSFCCVWSAKLSCTYAITARCKASIIISSVRFISQIETLQFYEKHLVERVANEVRAAKKPNNLRCGFYFVCAGGAFCVCSEVQVSGHQNKLQFAQRQFST